MTYEPILPRPIEDSTTFNIETIYLVWLKPDGTDCRLAQYDGGRWFCYPELDERLSPIAYVVPSLTPSS